MNARLPPSGAVRPSPTGNTALLTARLRQAASLIMTGQAAAARAELAPLAAAEPGRPEIHHLLGRAHEQLNSFAEAEGALRSAIAQDKRNPAFHTDLGLLLDRLGRTKAAEKALRAALALQRRYEPATTALAELLNRHSRHAEALQVTLPLAALDTVGEGVLSAHADALRGLGRHEERFAACERAVMLFPDSGVAEHNLAAALVDLDRFGEGEDAVGRAFAKGFDTVQTRTVLARAHQGRGDHDGAEAAFRAALDRQPQLADVQRDLAQLTWMRTGDVKAASERIDLALARDDGDPALTLVKAQLLESAGDLAGAYDVLARSRHHSAANVQIAAARAALYLDPGQALIHARAAASLAPGDAAVDTALCEAMLATGDAQGASAILTRLRRDRPHDQHLLAYQATAWRLLDDPRYRALYDYDRLVRTFTIAAPAGWGSLSAFLADLASALEALHTLRNHPFGQSLRLGSQTGGNLTKVGEPVIRAFFQAVDDPILSYIAALGPGRDALRERNLGGYEILGAWSVRLRPGGGRHVDHVHQKGWLSSAFYVDLADAVAADRHDGWIRFGAPGIPTHPALEAEYAIKPEPGRLVLFPSYMWHGVQPFGGEGSRLSMAFDLSPRRLRHPGSGRAQAGG